MRTVSIFRPNAQEFLENISQALFFRNAYFGFAFLALVLGFDAQLFACGIAAALVGFACAKSVRTPHMLKASGLITINGFFFGIAMASLYQKTPVFYGCLLVGAFTVPLLTKAAFEVLQHWKLTPMILPYILAVWVFSLCGDGIALRASTEALRLRHAMPIELLTDADLLIRMASSAALGIGRIFFLPDTYFGISLLVLVACFDPRRALYFFLGTALATLIAFVASTGAYPWELGLSSFSAGILGLGLASLPEKFQWKTILLFCAISVFLNMAIERLLGGLGLAPLSLTFVLTFWFAQLSRAPRLNLEWSPSESYLR